MTLADAVANARSSAALRQEVDEAINTAVRDWEARGRRGGLRFTVAASNDATLRIVGPARPGATILADALRRKDADMRLPGAAVLDFDQLNTPEQARWSTLATVAAEPLREAADELDRLGVQLEAFGFTRSAMQAHDAARKARRWIG